MKPVNVAAVSLVLGASLVTGAVGIAPMMEVPGFDLYDPADSLNIFWDDYRTGSNTGISSPTPTQWPMETADFPYRTVLFGSHLSSANNRQTDAPIYVIFSKTPNLEATGYVRFSYEENRVRDASGQILMEILGIGLRDYGETWLIKYCSSGMDGDFSGRREYHMNRSSTHRAETDVRFDFYYQCCPHDNGGIEKHLTVPGLRSISDVPYPYILTCKNTDGSGGGHQGGGDESSGGGNGSGGDKDWDKWKPSEPGGPYPWEDDDQSKYVPEISIPDGGRPDPGGNGEDGMGDTGENGGGWELPEWGKEKPDYDPDNPYFPEMPDVDFPEIEEPDFEFPGIKEPDFEFPEIEEPGFEFPGITEPDLEFPEIKEPDFEFPGVKEPQYPGGTDWPPPFPG